MKKTAKIISKAIKEDNFDKALAGVQAAMGITDGGFASTHFSDLEQDKSGAPLLWKNELAREKMIFDYMKAEILSSVEWEIEKTGEDNKYDEELSAENQNKIFDNLKLLGYDVEKDSTATEYLLHATSKESMQYVKKSILPYVTDSNTPASTKHRRGTPIEKYVFTGNRGDMAIAQADNSHYKLKKNEQLLILKSEYYRNGEFHIMTSKGELPSVLFYERA